jgi:hypothetical protein
MTTLPASSHLIKSGFPPQARHGLATFQRKCDCGAHTPGGGSCERCAGGRGRLQHKLSIGAANDPLEHEADRVADQVLAAPSPGRIAAAPARIQRLAPQGAEASDAVPVSVDQTLRGGGRPLDRVTRDDMEQRFGHDFSQVRVHDDGAAQRSAREVNARAYTVGNAIVFGAGEYAPRSASGRHLLAHELTHTIQQGAPVLRAKPVRAETGGRAAAAAPAPKPVCGPEIKGWFVSQVAAAKGNAEVLKAQRLMALADREAWFYGTSAKELSEGGAAVKTLWEETKLKWAGKAPTGKRPSADLAGGASSGVSAATKIGISPFPASGAALALYAIYSAAQIWKKLVNHGAFYDFKTDTMKNPTTESCGLDTCASSITLCGGGADNHCYLTDLPGNMFYALIGKYVGFNERTLQLGSQFAQLTSPTNVSWDPPEDTAAIRLGFSLPLELSEAKLCAAMPKWRSSLNTKPACPDCNQPTTAIIK